VEMSKFGIEGIEGFALPRANQLPDLDFYMDQVVSIMEKYLHILSVDDESRFITPAMINNYVKLGIIPPPEKKRYTKEHLCYLFIICTLKSVLPIPSVSLIINTELKNRTIFELYDIFCETYEKMLSQSVATAKKLSEEESDAKTALGKLSLLMAVGASASELVAENALKSFAPESEPIEKEKKKEKDKKEKSSKK